MAPQDPHPRISITQHAIALLASTFLLLIAILSPSAITSTDAQAVDRSFVFTAAGDHDDPAINPNTNASMNAVASSGSAFYLALGDLSYQSGNEAAWCSNFKARFNYVEVIAGNHETGVPPEGDIDRYIQYCPFALPGTSAPVQEGTYGKRYYFDYPQATPLARFIMIAPGIGGNLSSLNTYNAGGAGYTFTQSAIQDAKARGIKWIVVGMHENCISAATKSCEIGTDIMDLLINERVDLILQGHDHVYQRSHALSCITVNSVNPACIADDGSDGVYAKGAGPVIVVNGEFGRPLYSINPQDTEFGYFAKLDASTFGISRFSVTESGISGTFVRSAGGTFTDSFSINEGSAPPNTPVTFIARGSSWRYLDTNTRPANWQAKAFDDSAWKQGNAELGYGDGDEATIVSYGPNASSKYTTTYFRKSFVVANPASVASVMLSIRRDDGAIVYLNGNEVFRTNMPAGSVSQSTFASSALYGAGETDFVQQSISPSLLQPGANVIAVEIHQADLTSSDISFNLDLLGTIAGAVPTSTPTQTPPPTAVAGPVTFIPEKSSWKYLDNGTDQGSNWRVLSFDDSAWKTGNAELGYGDGGEATIVSYGPNPNSKYITTYFRKKFFVANRGSVTALTMALKRDDGAVVYLNGTEIFRSNITGSVNYNTLAATAIEDETFYQVLIDPARLLEGDNVIAIEVHQAAGNSSDLSMDFRLTGTVSGVPTSTPTPAPTSTPSPTPTPSPTGPQTMQLNPIADAHVYQIAPDTNYGASTAFEVDGSPVEITYMKFDLSGLAGKTILSATLRFKTVDSSFDSQDVRAVAETTWSETSLTYNNRPPLGNVLASMYLSSPEVWKEVALTSEIQSKAGAMLSLGLASPWSDGISFYSRESANKPVLVVEYR